MTQQDLAASLHDAIGQHGAWKLRLKTAMLTGRAQVTSAEASRCDCCAFGQWLDDPKRGGAHAASVPHRVVHRIHAEFHQLAGQVISAIEAGDMAQAQSLFEGQFLPSSEHLVRNISKWLREVQGSRAA